jgi:hypothetical protein
MADIKPTPTQEENDRTASGEHVIDHEHDGSAPESGGPPPAEGAVPVIDSMSPTTGPLPAVSLRIAGQNFTAASVVVFDGEPQATSFNAPAEVVAVFTYDGVPGTYPVLVRDVAGDSNAVSFTFTEGEQTPSAAEMQARGRRRR